MKFWLVNGYTVVTVQIGRHGIMAKQPLTAIGHCRNVEGLEYAHTVFYKGWRSICWE